MQICINAWEIPVRLATGAFILNSGLSKRTANDAKAAHLQGFAAGTYPFLNKLDTRLFVRAPRPWLDDALTRPGAS